MNAADEKAWQEYDSYIENAKVPFVDNTLSNEDAATVVKFILKAEKNALIAGRASRNSEVEGLREALQHAMRELTAAYDFIRRKVWPTASLRNLYAKYQDLTKGDSDV